MTTLMSMAECHRGLSVRGAYMNAFESGRTGGRVLAEFDRFTTAVARVDSPRRRETSQ